MIITAGYCHTQLKLKPQFLHKEIHEHEMMKYNEMYCQ